MFPSILNTFSRPTPTDRLNSPSHSALHNTVSSAVGQIEAVIGVEGANSVAGTLEYFIKSPDSNGGGHVQTANKGGTGQTSFTKGDLLIATSSSVLSKLAIGVTGKVLTANSSTASGVEWASSAVVDSIIPIPAYPNTVVTNLDRYESSITAYIGRILTPVGINNATKISYNVYDAGVPGALRIGIFSSDGQTQICSVTTATISANGDTSTTIPSTNILAGVYYYVIIPVAGAVIGLRGFSKPDTGFQSSVIGKPTYIGVKSILSGQMPTTIIPSSIAGTTNTTIPVLRFDI